MNKLEDIERLESLNLPKSYKIHLASFPDYSELYFKDDDNYDEEDFPGRPWCILGFNRLIESIEMKGVGTQPAYRALRLYMKLYAEFSFEKSVYSPQGKIPISRVENGFTIGTENGDYLYLDPEDGYSVWIYYHDGSDVKKVSESYEAWLDATLPA